MSKTPAPNGPESGRDLPEGEPKEEQIKWLKVFCQHCRAAPGQPCFDSQLICSRCGWTIRKRLNPYSLHVIRVMLYEAFALGTVDEYGRGSAGTLPNKAVNRE